MTFPKSGGLPKVKRIQTLPSAAGTRAGSQHRRIPAMLAATQPRGQAEHTPASRGGLLREKGQPAFGGPSVWPSVTSQKQTVPSGYAAHVPKITEV